MGRSLESSRPIMAPSVSHIHALTLPPLSALFNETSIANG